MMTFSPLLSIRALLLITALGFVPVAPVHAEIRRVSVNTSGEQGNQLSEHPSLSADGKTVAFHSGSTNLDGSDTHTGSDVFVHDLTTAATRIASISAEGTTGSPISSRPALRPDGKAVVFQSEDNSLVPGDGNDRRDIFLKDLTTGDIRIVSLSVSGEQSNGHCSYPRFSQNGNFVVFISEATNLVPGDTNEKTDVFVKDLTTGEVKIASAAADGALGNGDSTFPSVSGDGNLVAFASAASNFVKLDTNRSRDVFVKNMTTGEIRRLSVSATGQQGDTHSDEPLISADGKLVVFGSESRFLVPNDTNGDSDLFLCDLEAGTIRRVSVSSTGGEQNRASFTKALSADGKVLAFDSDSDNLVPLPGPNGISQVYVKDLTTGEVRLISAAPDGKLGNDSSYSLALSADGKTVAFRSDATNLVAGDSNNRSDVFVTETGLGGTVVPTPKLGDLNADNAVNVQDVTLLLQFVVGMKAPTGEQTTAGDVRKNGQLTVEDAVSLLQHIVFGTPFE